MPKRIGLPLCQCGQCLFCWRRHERTLASRRRYRHGNPEAVAAQKRAAYEKRKTYYLEQARRWAEANREKSNAVKRAWAERNPEKQRKIERRKNARNNRRRRGVPLDTEATQYAEILIGDPCSYCGSTSNITIDHIVPVAKGGTSSWDNLTAACLSCNSRKQTRPLLHFLVRRREVAG